MSSKVKLKKEKSKISKLIEKSDSENDENERELSFYINDRVKLMKEVLKIIKPKKIKNMAPDCIKDLDIEEINSSLLEELLGISNKRLKCILNGQNLGEDSSSTDPEEEKQPIDVISLDDVSDDDFVIEVDAESSRKKDAKGKREPKRKKVKKEKQNKVLKKNDKPLEEENLMSVLELLELQARARAIRSQLMLEANKKSTASDDTKTNEALNDDDDEDAVIIEIPKNEEIVINSSDSEMEQQKNISETTTGEGPDSVDNENTQKKKITLIRDNLDKQITEIYEGTSGPSVEKNKDKNIATHDKNKDENISTHDKNEDTNEQLHLSETPKKNEDKNNDNTQAQTCINDEDEIILIVDQEEMEGIIGD